MGFKKMTKAKYPPRLWSLVGYAGAGKSTFASQMRGPMVVVDADHRFQEVMELANNEVYELSDVKSDNVDPDRINTLLMKNMPGTKVETIVVDSLTAIITPLVVQAMVDHDSGKQKNLAAAFRTKALAMRQLQDAVTRWGCDVLWIYHHQDARDGRANEVKRATISPTEQARLTRSINVQLEIAIDERSERRGIKVAWARRGRSGMTIWDESGCWEGMPQKIEEAIYEGLTPEEQEQIEQENPTHFNAPEHAQAWSVDKGAFPDV
ncbi:MAG: AAA family ATPase, partial [Myxococcota bacterium]